MVATLPANFVRHVKRSGITPVAIVTFETNDAKTFKWVSSPKPLFGYPASVSEITTLTSSVDPVTRAVGISDVSITFIDDGDIRAKLQTERFKGALVTIEVGTVDMLEADFVTMYPGFLSVEDIIPDRGRITVRAADVTGHGLEKKIKIASAALHPLQTLEAVLELIAPAGKIDSAAFDPDGGDYDDISHWTTDLTTKDARDRTIGSPTEIKAIIEWFSFLMNGAVVSDEQGRFTFRRVDPSGSAVRRLTDDDMITGSFQQQNTFNNQANTIGLLFGKKGTIDEGAIYSRRNVFAGAENHSKFNKQMENSASDYLFRLNRIDDDELVNISLPGSVKREADLLLDTPLVNSDFTIAGFTGTGAEPSVRLIQGLGGLSGVRDIDGAQPATAKIGPTRLAYIAVFKPDERGRFAGAFSNAEIIALRNPLVLFDTVGVGEYIGYDDIGTFDIRSAFAVDTSIDAGDRAQFGTTAQNWGDDAVAVDITQPISMLNRLIKQFSNGAPVLTYQTSLEQIDLELTDLVEIDHQLYIRKGQTPTDKFEIIGKAVDPIKGIIRWVVIFSQEVTPSSLSLAVISNEKQNQTTQQRILQKTSKVFEPQVLRGLEVTAVSTGVSFDIDISGGSISGESALSVREVPLTLTVQASKDTYVIYDTSTQVIRQKPTTLGSGLPTLISGEALLAKVISDGSAVTDVLDLRNVEGGATDVAIGKDSVTANSIDVGGVFGRSLVLNGSFEQNTGLVGQSFETPPDGWSVEGGDWGSAGPTAVMFVPSAGGAGASGNYAVRVRSNAPNTALLVSKAFPVHGDAVYIGELTFKASTTIDEVAYEVRWLDNTKATISTATIFQGTADISSTFQRETGVVTAPSTARFAQVIYRKVDTSFFTDVDHVAFYEQYSPSALIRNELLHFLDGPWEDWPSGAYREILPAASTKPTSIIWWESSGKTKKIFEIANTYTGANLTTAVYRVFEPDGVTVKATATDTIAYTGAFEINRTRVFS